MAKPDKAKVVGMVESDWISCEQTPTEKVNALVVL